MLTLEIISMGTEEGAPSGGPSKKRFHTVCSSSIAAPRHVVDAAVDHAQGE
jgi:hypothetical protein